MNANVRSVGVKDVDQSEFVKKLADFLKKSGKLKVPEWVDLVKTGVYKELAPFDEDWFYIRCASVARHLYLRSPVGVGSLTKIYGGRYRKGTRPSHYCKGGQNIARKSLQSLEGIKWVEKDANTGGRRLTRQGYQDLDRIAAQLRSQTKARLLAEAAIAAQTV